MLLIAGALVTATPAPDQRGGGPASGPLVTVEFRAVTSGGSPVSDLKASDVTLKVDGKERVIRSFDLLTGGKTAAAPRADVAPPFATNALTISNTRDTLLVVDDEAINPGEEKRIVNALEQYMSGLGESDRIGIVTVQDRGLNVSFTNDRAVIRKAIGAMVGRARAAESADDTACRTRRDLDALVSVSNNFPMGGSPVTVLFFSTGMTPPGTATMSGARNSSTSGNTMCEVMPRDYQTLQAAATASTMNLYVVAAALPPSQTQQAGIENLAGLSGNAMVQLVKGGDGDMVRLVRENAAQYRVTFEPEMSERNGSTQHAEVAVKRAGVETHMRGQILIPKVDMVAANAQPSPKDMLKEARIRRDFQFRAAAFASKETGSDKIKVVVMFEPNDPTGAIKSAVLGLYDAKGKLTVQGTAEAANLTRSPAVIAVLAAPGTYRMRIAAVDTAGRAGTVDSQVEVGLSKADPLQLGTMILGVADGGAFAGRLTFSTESSAIGYLEVYGPATAGQLSAVVELAESETGPALVAGATKILGDGVDGHRVILGGVPLTQFAAGDYVVRIVVSLDGKVVGKVTRTLRKRSS